MSEQAPTITTTLSLAISLSLQCQRLGADGYKSIFSLNSQQNYGSTSFSDGSVANTLNVHNVHAARYSLTPASGTLDIDLAALLNPHGLACNFTKIKAIYARNTVAFGGGQLLIGPSPSNGWTIPWSNSGAPTTVKENIESGGNEFFKANVYAGFAVNTGSRNLRFTHNGGSSGTILFDLVVVGF